MYLLVPIQLCISDFNVYTFTTVFTTSEKTPSNWEFPIPNCKFPPIRYRNFFLKTAPENKAQTDVNACYNNDFLSNK